MIGVDLDGTLLNSDHIVTPFTEQAVREAIAQGVLFTVATGKTYSSTPDLARQFDIQIPIICGNGTVVYRPDGTVLFEDPIPRELAIEAVRMARAAGVWPVVYAGRGLLASAWDANVEELVAHHEPVPEIIPDLERALATDHTPAKLVLMHQDRQTLVDFQEQLEATFAGRAQVMRSGLASVVELLPLGVTKGTALAFVLDHLGLSALETMALGDSFNDLDMIRRAGIGVAMGNAPPPVRAGADYVTGTNDEDGVGHAIRRFVLDARSVGAR